MRLGFQRTFERIAIMETPGAGAFPCAGRRGTIALEMLLILPVFLALLVGFVEFSSIVVVEERLEAASAQGARVASQGGSVTDVYTAVNYSLGPGGLQDNRTITITNPAAADPTAAIDPTMVDSGTPIMVRVEVTANLVVPDLLRFIGYSLSNQALVGQSVMRKE